MNEDETEFESWLRGRLDRLGSAVDRVATPRPPLQVVAHPHDGRTAARAGSGRIHLLGSLGIAAALISVIVLVEASVRSGATGAVGTGAPTVTASAAQSGSTKHGFVVVGSMSTPRLDPSATLLKDGRVLVAGGWDGARYLKSAELYDPRGRAFSATGSMPRPLGGQTATLLDNGEVLIAGGFDGGTNAATSAALLYNPTTGNFTPTGSMLEPRSYHSAVSLRDGRVLIVGGFGTDYLDTAEVYDPATGEFAKAGSIPVSMHDPITVRLPNGRILLVGSGTPADPGPAPAAIYDPTTGQFSAAGSMLSGWAESAWVLPDGRVLIVGEKASPSGAVPVARPLVETYDPASGTFALAAAPTDGDGRTTAILRDGSLLVVGGLGGQGSTLLRPARNSAESGPSLPVVQISPVALPLSDGTVLIAGGHGPNTGDVEGPVLSTAELYVP